VKLVICTPSYWPERNGVATVATTLAERFAVMGYDVTAIAPRCGDRPRQERHGGIAIVPVDTAGRGTLLSPYRGDIAGYRQLLRDLKADVYLFICWENWLVDCAAEGLGTLPGKKVLASHGTSGLWRPPGVRGLARLLLYLPHALRYTRLLSRFDHFIFLTTLAERARFYDKLLCERLHLSNWTTIPNGSDMAMSSGCAQAFRERHHLGNGFIILCVGNFHWAKNQATLIRAFFQAQLKGATLVLIGHEMNSYARKLHRLAAQGSEREQRVLLLTKQSRQDIADAYSAADLYASASITEAQPLSILDAMVSGTPFLSLNVGCVAEFQGGVVVKNEREFVCELKSLAADQSRRAQLGETGREVCAREYNWDRTAQAYHRTLQRLLTGGAGGEDRPAEPFFSVGAAHD
jgi:glycosyltransferase involved in cell wall biosynthesis